MSFGWSEDERNIQFLLQNSGLLEKLHLSVRLDWSLVGIHDILSSTARTLKSLHLTVPLHSVGYVSLPLGGLCEELKAMAGKKCIGSPLP